MRRPRSVSRRAPVRRAAPVPPLPVPPLPAPLLAVPLLAVRGAVTWRAHLRHLPAAVLMLAVVCASAGCTTVNAPPQPLPRDVPSSAVPGAAHDVPDGASPVPPPAHQVLDTVGGRPHTAAPALRHRKAGDDGRTAGRLLTPRRTPARTPARVPPVPPMRTLPRPSDVCAFGLRYATPGQADPAYAGRVAGRAAARVCAGATTLP